MSQKINDYQTCFSNEDKKISILMKHWGIATTLANEYRNIPMLEFDDILQHARIGLLKAVMNFDVEKGAAFSTYAWRVVSNELNTLYVKQYRYASRETVALEYEDEENAKNIPHHAMVDEKEDVFKRVEFQENKKAVYREIEHLSDRQKKVIQGVIEGCDYREIGKKLGFSAISAKTLVSRAYQSSLKNLKEALQAQGFEISKEAYVAT